MKFNKLIKSILNESILHEDTVFIGFATDSFTWMGDVETYTRKQAEKTLGLKDYESTAPYLRYGSLEDAKPVENDDDLRNCISQTIINILDCIEDYTEEHGEANSLTEAEVRRGVVDGFSPYLAMGLTGTWWFSPELYGLLISFVEYNNKQAYSRAQQINKDLQDVDATGFEGLL